MKKYILGILTGLIISIVVGVTATILYNANEIEYYPKDNTWNVDNVEDAVNDIKDNYMPNSKVENDYMTKENVDNNYAIVNNFKSSNLNMIWNYSYTGKVGNFVAPLSGTYKVELWGAQGGAGGNGAYTSGNIKLSKSTALYIYVGGTGATLQQLTNVGGWNGGGYSGNYSPVYSYGGGGATDVRLLRASSTETIWNESKSLNSRIMVAAGGGGSFGNNSATKVPGVGGGLNGGSADGSWDSNVISGATQTSGGKNISQGGRDGLYGMAIQSIIGGWGGGGGGGFYGGALGYGKAGSGGSSYISGYTGCVAVKSENDNTPKAGCVNGTTNNSCSIHYSNYVFSSPKMVAGNASMPNTAGTGNETGHAGNGYAKITLVSID